MEHTERRNTVLIYKKERKNILKLIKSREGKRVLGDIFWKNRENEAEEYAPGNDDSDELQESHTENVVLRDSGDKFSTES